MQLKDYRRLWNDANGIPITGLEHLLDGKEALLVVWSSMLLRCARGAIVMPSSTS